MRDKRSRLVTRLSRTSVPQTLWLTSNLEVANFGFQCLPLIKSGNERKI